MIKIVIIIVAIALLMGFIKFLNWYESKKGSKEIDKYPLKKE